MLTKLLTILLYAVIVVLTMVITVLLLMLINHFLLHPEDDYDKERLKNDVINADNVITRDSLFHKFLERAGDDVTAKGTNHPDAAGASRFRRLKSEEGRRIE